MLFYLADIALVEIHLDMTGQTLFPDFLYVFTETQELVGLLHLFFFAADGSWSSRIGSFFFHCYSFFLVNRSIFRSEDPGKLHVAFDNCYM